MSVKKAAAPRAETASDAMAALRRRYGCGPVELTGSADALYERHLLFDNVADPAVASPRERYEALARSVRDVLSQRWVRTEQTYERENPKRVYYLSMEFLIGRSLTNNITNLLLSPVVDDVVKRNTLDWLGLLEQEPDAGLGNGGLGRLAACFLDSMATMQLPAIGYGLRYEYGMFRQSIENGWQNEQPDNWLRRPDPWEVIRPDDKVEVKLNCSVELREGALTPIAGRPSTLIGIPYDRPVVGYGGKTINTLRLWAASAPYYFDFQAFSHGQFVSALAGTRGRKALARGLHPHAPPRLCPQRAFLPGALEKWPLAWFEAVLPRHLELGFEINRRLLDDVRRRFPGDDGRVARTSLIEEGATTHVRMANLAIVGSHSTNGVAAIHSALLRSTTVKDLAEMFPDRFGNKTKGVKTRRWSGLANTALGRI